MIVLSITKTHKRGPQTHASDTRSTEVLDVLLTTHAFACVSHTHFLHQPQSRICVECHFCITSPSDRWLDSRHPSNHLHMDIDSCNAAQTTTYTLTEAQNAPDPPDTALPAPHYNPHTSTSRFEFMANQMHFLLLRNQSYTAYRRLTHNLSILIPHKY